MVSNNQTSLANDYTTPNCYTELRALTQFSYVFSSLGDELIDVSTKSFYIFYFMFVSLLNYTYIPYIFVYTSNLEHEISCLKILAVDMGDSFVPLKSAQNGKTPKFLAKI